MEKDMETILDWCLDQMRRGKKIEDCLESYSQLAGELRPLLLLAKDIEGIPTPEPRKEALNLALMRVGEAISTARRRRPFFQRIFLHGFLVRPAVAGALSLALILVFIGWAVGMLSADSLPGDWLYAVKKAGEGMKYTLTRSADAKAELRMEFSGERLDELIRTVEESGALDKTLLQNLLNEAELALDEAQPVKEDTFTLIAAKLNHFTACQKAVLEQLKPRVPSGDRSEIDKAIELCRRRCRCLKRMIERKEPGDGDREWDSGCRCRDMCRNEPSRDDSPE